MEITKKEILALDPLLFSNEEKKQMIDLLYGDQREWTWKNDLQSVASNLLRWKLLLSPVQRVGPPFCLSHQSLMRLAEIRRPSDVRPSLSGFLDWIYRLYVPEKDYTSLLNGHRLEREIIYRHIPIPSHGRWKLIHNGLGATSVNAFPIRSLSINGIPLKGSPDLVFREKDSGRIAIVEIKATEAEVPLDGWPNLRAQLWAYAQIDAWQDAPEILLIGEVWGYKPRPRLRKIIHWAVGEQPFDTHSRELFNSYKLHFEHRIGICNRP